MKNTKVALAVGICCLAVANVGQASLAYLDVSAYGDYTFNLNVQGTGKSGVISSAFSANLSPNGGGYVNNVYSSLPVTHADPFVTFCLDIDTVLGSGWWNSGTFSSVPLTTDQGYALRQSDGLYYAATLYQSFSSGIMNANGSWNDKAKGAALGLAIWEVLYETTPGAFLLGSGSGFSVSSGNSGVRTAAQTMLNSLSTAGVRNAPNYSLNTMFWNASNVSNPGLGGRNVDNGNVTITSRSSQDLIGPFTPVPEPGTIIAGALLLLPFGISTLRVWRKSQS